GECVAGEETLDLAHHKVFRLVTNRPVEPLLFGGCGIDGVCRVRGGCGLLWRHNHPGRRLLRHDPNIPIEDWIAVALKLEWASVGTLRLAAGRRTIQLEVLKDGNPVVFDGGDGVFDFLAGAVESRSRELDVVGLPGEGRITHVERRSLLRVNAAALVILALEAE